MTIDTPQVQKQIGLWSSIMGLAVFLPVYLLGYRLLAWGVLFGVSLMVVNSQIVSRLLDRMFSMAHPDIAKLLGFISYQLRFALIIVIMFLVITRLNMTFGVGTFVGFVINKLATGFFVIRTSGREWWNDKRTLPSQPEENEDFKTYNPFEIDPVEEEIKKHFKF